SAQVGSSSSTVTAVKNPFADHEATRPQNDVYRAPESSAPMGGNEMFGDVSDAFSSPTDGNGADPRAALFEMPAKTAAAGPRALGSFDSQEAEPTRTLSVGRPPPPKLSDGPVEKPAGRPDDVGM